MANPNYWVNEADTDNCAGCSKPFSYSVWKHHCRACGEVFCSECSDKKRSVPERGYTTPVRVCNLCYLQKTKDADKTAKEPVNVYLSEAEVSARASHQEVMESMLRMYKARVRPLEQKYNFDFFMSPLTDGDFMARPMVLLLGQYSVGKTTFIQNLLERDFPGIRIGPEPTTDRFVAITYGILIINICTCA